MNSLIGNETSKQMHKRLWKSGASIEEYQEAFSDPNVKYFDHSKWFFNVIPLLFLAAFVIGQINIPH